jgi:hypothetical protein
MAKLYDPFITQTSLPQLRDFLVRDAGGIVVDPQGKFNKRPEPSIRNCLRSFRHKLPDLAFVGLLAGVQNCAEGGGAIWTAVGFGHCNSHMLDLIHTEFAHLPKDFGSAPPSFALKNSCKSHLHIEMVGNRTFHLRSPIEDLADCGIVNLLRLRHFYSRHNFRLSNASG